MILSNKPNHAHIRITTFLGYLSAKKPEGEKRNIKGSKMSALITLVKSVSSLPS